MAGVRRGRLLVEDSGGGIVAEHLRRVFERFWRAPGAPLGGTGLGLAIAAWIVERHGGTIAAANRASGAGARFSVTPFRGLRRGSPPRHRLPPGQAIAH